jgi:pimeloyl-ACP methyl ester carboxylesterase
VESTAVEGRPVRSLTAGRRTGAPEIVLVPGLGAPGYLVPWARRSSAWTRTTILDLPGWQGGHARSCDATLVDTARTAARWLEVTGRRDVVLVGHSTGAQVVLLSALQAEDRLAGLCLAGPTFAPAARSLPAAARRAVATMCSEPVGAAEIILPSYVRSGGAPLLRFVRTALDDRPEDHVRDVAAPVLLMSGRRDPFCPLPWARYLADRAGTVCHELDGGHLAQYGDPNTADDLLHRAVRSWTARRIARVPTTTSLRSVHGRPAPPRG